VSEAEYAGQYPVEVGAKEIVGETVEGENDGAAVDGLNDGANEIVGVAVEGETDGAVVDGNVVGESIELPE
jgi:hypothetical protein